MTRGREESGGKVNEILEKEEGKRRKEERRRGINITNLYLHFIFGCPSTCSNLP